MNDSNFERYYDDRREPETTYEMIGFTPQDIDEKEHLYWIYTIGDKGKNHNLKLQLKRNWIWNDNEDKNLSLGTLIVEEPPQEEENGSNITDGDIIELQQYIQELEEDIERLNSDLQDALNYIESTTSSTSDSINEFESEIEDAVEDAVQSKQDSVEAKALATEAKNIADDAENTANEAKNVASQAKDDMDGVIEDLDEVKKDAEKALNSSRGTTTMVYLALVASLVAAVMTFFGPFQITKKPFG